MPTFPVDSVLASPVGPGLGMPVIPAVALLSAVARTESVVGTVAQCACGHGPGSCHLTGILNTGLCF